MWLLVAISFGCSAANLGYVTKPGEFPTKGHDVNVCAICDTVLRKALRLDQVIAAAPTAAVISAWVTHDHVWCLWTIVQDDGADGKIFKLECGHSFHEFCLRGNTQPLLFAAAWVNIVR